MSERAPARANLTGGGLARRVIRRVGARWGARLGLAWIGALAALAVASPLIANSHPFLMRVDGSWSSPWLAHLRPQDVALFASAAAAAVILPLGRFGLGARLVALAGVSALASILAVTLVTPPEAVVYSRYREMAEAGKIEAAYRAPVPYSPADNLRDQSGVRLEPPSLAHPMGTVSDGADLFAHMIYGTRIALSIGFVATGIAVLIGILIGGAMGYFAGLLDLFGMRLVEIFKSVPPLYLMLIFVAAFEANLYMLMVIIGLTSWGEHALFLRGEFLRLRHQDFVSAARASGLPLRSVLFRHMLPNGIAPVLVTASFGVANAVLAESVLSFLQIGLVEVKSWGKLLSEALGVGGTFYWWIALYPGLAIFLTVFSYVLVGEALRDALDPRIGAGE